MANLSVALEQLGGDDDDEDEDEDARMKSARRRSRELATQGLYQWLLSGAPGGEIDAQLRNAQGFDKADHDHLDAILHGVIKEADALSAQLQPCLDRPVEQLSPVERAVLLVAAIRIQASPRHSVSRGHQRGGGADEDLRRLRRLQVRERRARQAGRAVAPGRSARPRPRPTSKAASASPRAGRPPRLDPRP